MLVTKLTSVVVETENDVTIDESVIVSVTVAVAVFVSVIVSVTVLVTVAVFVIVSVLVTVAVSVTVAVTVVVSFTVTVSTLQRSVVQYQYWLAPLLHVFETKFNSILVWLLHRKSSLILHWNESTPAVQFWVGVIYVIPCTLITLLRPRIAKEMIL